MDFAVTNAIFWAGSKLMWIDWIDSCEAPSTFQEFLLDRVGPDKQKSQEREDFGRKFVAVLKLGEFCEVFNWEEWLWDKDQQYVKKTCAAQLLAKPSRNLGVLCGVCVSTVKDTLCRFAGQDARGIRKSDVQMSRWQVANWFEALDPDKRITAEDDRHWASFRRFFAVAGDERMSRFGCEALRHHFVEDPKALKAAGKKVGMGASCNFDMKSPMWEVCMVCFPMWAWFYCMIFIFSSRPSLKALELRASARQWMPRRKSMNKLIKQFDVWRRQARVTQWRRCFWIWWHSFHEFSRRWWSTWLSAGPAT